MPTPSGKATDMPAMEVDADRRMLDALKITPPSRIQPKLEAEACPRSWRKGRPCEPKLPRVKASSSAKMTMPIT